MSEQPRTTKLGEDENGELVAMDWPDADGLEQSLAAQISSTPQAGQGHESHSDDVGPVARAASHSGIWGSIDLRTFTLNSTELSTTVKRFRDEMYRNQFPVLVPSFAVRCTDCGTEYDEERDRCEVCGASRPEAFETPSREQKHWLDRFVKRVNDDGQSLMGLMKYEEDFQSYRGVSTILARIKYQHVTEETRVAGREVQSATRWEPTEIKELVHAAPTRIMPVLDENDRHGGWWTCPGHRDRYWEAGDLTFVDDADHPTEVCPECHAQLEEVGYVETESGSTNDIESLYLKHEVIDWARHFPIRNGLDGRSPIRPLVKLQAILQWSRNYDLQYLSPQNDQQLPDKFLVAYGKNIQSSLRASLEENEAKNPWEEGRLTYEGNPDDVEIELLDLSTSSGLNGREPMIERLMSQIRAMFGISDAFENELSDTGGLNAEGTQVEITNAAIAAAHQDTKDKALDKLCRLIEMVRGRCDWELAYVDPESEGESLSPLDVLEGVRIAQETGTRASVEDGQLHIPDQKIEPAPAGDAQGGAAPGDELGQEPPDDAVPTGEPPPDGQQPPTESTPGDADPGTQQTPSPPDQ
jgi:hypothetical protein